MVWRIPLLLSGVVLACTGVLGAMPVGVRPSPCQVPGRLALDSMPHVVVDADSTPRLTADALARMTTFWTAFQHEPLAVRDTGSAQLQNREQVRIITDTRIHGSREFYETELVNMRVMAARYPSVAADFKQAGLTPQQWEGWRNAVMAARAEIDARKQIKADTPLPSTSVVAKNIALLTVFGQQYTTLVQAADEWNGPDN